MRRAVSLAGLLALAACNTPFNNNLPPGNMAGVWSGSLSSNGTTLGTLRMVLVPGTVEDPAVRGGAWRWTVSGSWSMSLTSGADSGALSGNGTSGSAFMQFTLQGAKGCSIDLNGGEFGGSSILGHYAASSCLAPDTGTFTVTRQ